LKKKKKKKCQKRDRLNMEFLSVAEEDRRTQRSGEELLCSTIRPVSRPVKSGCFSRFVSAASGPRRGITGQIHENSRLVITHTIIS
jgi:hypothetical protein